jgi:beta-barrel assembly-enhancing protease
MSMRAWFYDGSTAVRRDVEIQVIGKNFFLAEIERRHGPYAFSDLHYSGQQGASYVYMHDEIDGWRMGMAGDVPTDLVGLLPPRGKYGGWIDSIGLAKATVAFTVISAAVVAVVMLTPQWLAPLVPSSVEKQLGNALVGDFGGRFCNTPAGRKALAKMAGGLDKDISDIDIQVANIDMLNAVALPGGKVIIFQGLLDGASSPDEVAGVLAHEIGHVRQRHVMQSMIRQMGLSVVMGGLDGNVGGTLNGLLSMGYSRSAESEADNHAIKALASARISPLPTASFFDRLSELESPGKKDTPAKGANGEGKSVGDKAEGLLGYIASHPPTENRKKLFEKSYVKNKAYQPVLTQSEWASLKTMCANDKDVKSGMGFDFGLEEEPKKKK